MGMLRVAWCNPVNADVPLATMASGASGYQLGSGSSGALKVSDAPAVVDRKIASLHPTELLKGLSEGGDTSMSCRVGLGIQHQHPDPPQAVALLRTRRKRPCGSDAAEQRDELAPM
jgi:hypothetical protein